MTETRDLDAEALIGLTETYAAHNYHPLPVVLREGEGAWVTDVEGRRYLDCLAGYERSTSGTATRICWPPHMHSWTG